MSELSLFDLLPEEEAARFRPLKADDWKWTFADYPKQKNGLKVFSCFACGGGSTMGYKLAGFDVIGCCEIDPKMNETYIKNHHPKHNFLMDIRDFNAIPNEELPAELFGVDVIDGSPPCTTFSIAGDREESWGKKKKFREGQKEQTLDDLSFVFIETVKKLKPRIVVMENVEGLILGKAFSYVQQIYKGFDEAGYAVNHWLLKGELMGVPQKRHRVFFVAIRKDININPNDIDMTFHYEQVNYGTVKDGSNKKVSERTLVVLNALKPDENDCVKAWNRVHNPGKHEKRMWFNERVEHDENVASTIRATGSYFDYTDKAFLSDKTIANISTFPQDYDFNGVNTQYICGMSVPPVMMKRVATRLIDEGVFKYKLDNTI